MVWSPSSFSALSHVRPHAMRSFEDKISPIVGAGIAAGAVWFGLGAFKDALRFEAEPLPQSVIGDWVLLFLNSSTCFRNLLAFQWSFVTHA